MALPEVPTSLVIQQGNAKVYLSWDLQSDATSYDVQRSTDGVNYSSAGDPPTTPEFLDESVSVNTTYFYKVAGVNGEGTGEYTAAQSTVPTAPGFMSLGEVRLLAQQRADRQNSEFVTKAEWNSYINQSYFELYDLLTTLYEDYNVAAPLTFVTDGRANGLYPLPDGITVTDAVTSLVAAPFYKLLGVDSGAGGSSQAWVSVRKFEMAGRNRYLYPQLTSNPPGIYNFRYRLLGNQIQFIPDPGSNQRLRLWYIPRLSVLLKDSDAMDGVSGWGEYVIIDAAIKALMKEESDVTTLLVAKAQMQKRIEDAAMNRDAGMPDAISDVRTLSERIGGYGYGAFGGY